ncbi:hypothetical protein Tco_1145202 [Tanacetum coccineum]
MAEMLRLLKELTTSRTLERVLVREETSNPITKCVNFISLVKMEKDKCMENNEVVDKNVVESSELNAVEPIKLVDKKIKNHQGKEMGFNKWRSKVFDDEYLTSKKEDSMLYLIRRSPEVLRIFA